MNGFYTLKVISPRRTIVSGMLNELKYINYNLIKNLILNSIEAFGSFIINFQNNLFRT
jgi:hypothetical protein